MMGVWKKKKFYNLLVTAQSFSGLKGLSSKVFLKKYSFLFPYFLLLLFAATFIGLNRNKFIP